MSMNEAVTRPATPGSPAPDFRVVQLNASFETFGVLVDFLSRIDPFTKYDIGNFCQALRRQIGDGNHVAALSNRKLIGYCGWLPTKTAIAAAWVDNSGPLTPARSGESDAVALTVVAASDRRVLMSLIRRARKLNPQRRVFFKRDYRGNARPARKSSVQNVAT